MKHLNIDYYACLLIAALYHGATHQKPGLFQVITEKRIKRKLKLNGMPAEALAKAGGAASLTLQLLAFVLIEVFKLSIVNIPPKIPLFIPPLKISSKQPSLFYHFNPHLKKFLKNVFY